MKWGGRIPFMPIVAIFDPSFRGERKVKTKLSTFHSSLFPFSAEIYSHTRDTNSRSIIANFAH
ncbi:hypothetical protein, partial [Autumnicola edwardsiae]